MKNKIKTFPALILLSFVTFVAIVVVIYSLALPVNTDENSLQATNITFFRYFTSDSNILSALSSGILLYFLTRNSIKKEETYPNWVIKAHYITSIHTGVTMIITIFFLTPVNMALGNPPNALFSGYLFFFHFFSPLIYIISVIYFFPLYKITLKENLLGVLPVTVYSIIYLIMVVTNHWPDFYGFTFGGKYYLIPFSIIAMHLVSFMIGLIIRKMHNKRVLD